MAKWHMTDEQKRFLTLTREEKIDLFWSQVDMSAGASGCWPWRGKLNHNGYGQFTFEGDTAAYRIAYKLTNGEIGRGMHILHACDYRLCCNPAHLSEGTHADNMRDKVAKNRQWRGGAIKKGERD